MIILQEFICQIAKFYRKASSTPILVDCVAQIIKSKEVCKTPPSIIPTTPLAEYSVEDLEYINNRSKTQRVTRSLLKAANGDSRLSQKKGNNSSSRKVPSPVIESPHKLSDDDASPRIENLDNLLNTPFFSVEREKMNSNLRSDANGSKNVTSLKGSPLSKTPFSSSGGKRKNNSYKRSYHLSPSISSTRIDAEDDVSLKVRLNEKLSSRFLVLINFTEILNYICLHVCTNIIILPR